MKSAIVILLAVAFNIHAADDAESKKLIGALEGHYKLTSMELSGEPVPPGFLNVMEKVTFKGSKFTILFKSETKSEEKIATISVDAAQKPAYFNMTPDEGPKKDKASLGIVLIEGDVVKICLNDAEGAKRPTEFKSTKEGRTVLLVLKRVKQ